METVITTVVLSSYGIFGLFLIVALIYLIFRRLEDRRNEHFEKRDN